MTEKSPQHASAASAETTRESPRASSAVTRRYVRPTPIARATAWNDPLRRRMLACADLLAAAAAVVITTAAGDADFTGVLCALLLLPAWLLIAKIHGLYDADHARLQHSTSDEATGLIHTAVLCTAAVALLFALVPGAGLSPLLALLMVGSLLALVSLFRSGMRALWRRLVPPDRVLVIGDGALARAVERKLELEGDTHTEIVGIMDQFAPERQPLDVAAENLRADRVILAAEEIDESMLYEVLACCRRMHLKLSVAPPIQAMLGTAVSLTHLAELPMIEFRTWDASRSTMLFKRSFDIAASALALVVLTPLMIVVAVTIRIDSRGPAFFVQTRAGLHGAPFRMIKFRTMIANADAMLGELVSLDTLDEPVYKFPSDSRVTRVGAYLRRWSLDELPQLVNVIWGQMSLVGPRPEDVRLVARYKEPELFRLQMRPGVTGPMQVHGRGDMNFSERLAVEREYIENYSFSRDLYLLMRTVGAVIRGRGAY